MPIRPFYRGRDLFGTKIAAKRAIRQVNIRARRRAAAALARVTAKRALISRAYAGGALALGAMAGYGVYRGIRRLRNSKRAKVVARKQLACRMKPKGVKKEKVYDTFSAYGSRTLQNLTPTGILAISKGTQINNRLFDWINVHGLKIQMHIANSQEQPLMCTVALVRNKVDNTTPPTSTEWFRDYGNDTATDLAIAQNTLDMMSTPINTDKVTILERWNFTLGPRINETSISQPISGKDSNFKFFDKYIPIKRQFCFDQASTAPETDQLYLMMWCDRFQQAAGTTSTANIISIQHRIIVYFRDVQ